MSEIEHGALAKLKELVDWTVTLVSTLVRLNARQTQEIRDADGEIGDELIRGLDLVAQRIEEGKRITVSKAKGRKQELQHYTGDSQLRLSESFSENKVCRRLRKKRDHFKQLFHPVRLGTW